MENEPKKEARDKALVVDQLAVILKNENSSLLIRLMSYKGYRYLDLRAQLMENGEWKYGNGITLNKKTFPLLLEVLNSRLEDIETALSAIKPEV